ncbi:peptidyl-prolyl cis-trans isomerase B (cyclophilin B) [Streptococcus rupicaprae]|uniref:peptidylprolyl isomerase n=1 Tax=Streptococcus rupicaprae TaxID=759619 RepID=A0ABV2FG07_9STRE
MDSKTKYKAKKIKAIFFDIDDTLRVKDTGFMPESIKDVFAQLKSKGIITGIASGRAIYGVVPEIQALEPDYFVTINGAYVRSQKGEELFSRPIAPEVVQKFVDWTKEVGIDYGFVGKERAVVSKESALIDQAIIPVYGKLAVEPDFHLSNAVFQIWTFETVGDSLGFPEELAQDLRMVRWHPNSSDVVIKDTSKALGVAQVLEALKLKPENVLVFGDELNDMELFDYAGLAIAMGISHKDLQAKADFVTKTVEENGIQYALEELGMIEKQLTFPQLDLGAVEGPIATIKTNHGDMTLKLFPEQAPKTVANFLGLAKQGYYDGVIFHRIIKDFMIQGGDPTGTGMGGESIYGESFEDEFSAELYNIRGALSMANAGPNTNGSQFFIVQNDSLAYSAKELVRGGWPQEIAAVYATEGGTPHLDRRHTVFGQLADEASYEVLDKIASVQTGPADRPVDDVTIETIEVRD